MRLLIPATLRRLTINAARTYAVFALLVSLACASSASAWESSGDWRRGHGEEAHAASYFKERGTKLRHNRFVVLYPARDFSQRDFYITVACLDDFSRIYLIAFTDVLAGSEADYQFSVLRVDKSVLELGPSGTGRAGTAESPRHYRVSIEDEDEMAQVLEVFQTANNREDAKYVKLEVQRERTLNSVFNPAGVEDAMRYLRCFD